NPCNRLNPFFYLPNTQNQTIPKYTAFTKLRRP
uniref:Uncharacterized protein n=1 Tax=Ciona intestinalis TaxID=7719 RepID=H2XLU8_CIOIN